MWFQATECNAVNASILLNLINNNFLTFLTENLPILDPYLPPKSVNLWPHYSHSSWENATPSSNTSPLASCEGVPPPETFTCSWTLTKTSSGDFGIHNSTFFLLIKLQVTTIFVTKMIFQYTTSLYMQTPCHYRTPPKSDHNFPSLSQSRNLSHPLNIIFNYFSQNYACYLCFCIKNNHWMQTPVAQFNAEIVWRN